MEIFKILLLGLLQNSPTGIIGMMLAKQYIRKPEKDSLFLGYGVALADLLFSMVWILPFISLIRSWLDSNKPLINTAGGILMIVIGALSIASARKSIVLSKNVNESTLFVKGFLSSILNPLRFTSMVVLSATLDIIPDTSGMLIYATTILAGSFLWNIVYLLVLSKLSEKFRIRLIKGLSLGGGIIFCLLGLYYMYSTFS